jgi:hypothetical protein
VLVAPEVPEFDGTRANESDSQEEEELEVDVEDVAATSLEASCHHTYQLHLVYSMTYQVPVLYFNGRSEGTHPNREALSAPC